MATATRVGTDRTYLHASTTDTTDGDLDLIAIELAMNGQPAVLTRAERVEAARRLYNLGLELAAIAARIGSTRHTIRAWADADWPLYGTDEQPPIDIGNAKHGRSGYSKGCRCRQCRAGAAQKQREARARQAA